MSRYEAGNGHELGPLDIFTRLLKPSKSVQLLQKAGITTPGADFTALDSLLVPCRYYSMLSVRLAATFGAQDDALTFRLELTDYPDDPVSSVADYTTTPVTPVNLKPYEAIANPNGYQIPADTDFYVPCERVQVSAGTPVLRETDVVVAPAAAGTIRRVISFPTRGARWCRLLYTKSGSGTVNIIATGVLHQQASGGWA